MQKSVIISKREDLSNEEKQVEYLRLLNSKMSSIKDNVRFFAWVLALQLIAGLCIAVAIFG